MTGASFGSNRQTFRAVDDQSRLDFINTVIEKVRDSDTPVEEIVSILNTGGIALSIFDTYRSLEVTVLSDRELANKIELVHEIGRYTARVAVLLIDYIHESLDPEAMQYRALLQMCGIIEDGLMKVRSFDEGEAREHGLAGLQDQIRWGYQDRHIPVEDRSSYTEIAVPGRNFLDPQ